jgi:hypothetical protein
MNRICLGSVVASVLLIPMAHAAPMPAQGYFFDKFGSDNFLRRDGNCFYSLVGPVCVSGVRVINPMVVQRNGIYHCNENLSLPNGKKVKQLSPYGQQGGAVYECTAKGWILSYW